MIKLNVVIIIFIVSILFSFPSVAEQAVLDAQQALVDKGYDPGTVDGLWGGKTANALRAFQQDSDLPQTGKLDKATATLLGVQPWSAPAKKPQVFDSVAIQYALHSKVIGGTGASIGADGQLRPQSGATVYVFREIMDMALAKQVGVKVGGAYTEKGGKFYYVRDVDLSKTDEQIAHGFGVGSGKSISIPGAGSNNNLTIKVS